MIVLSFFSLSAGNVSQLTLRVVYPTDSYTTNHIVRGRPSQLTPQVVCDLLTADTQTIKHAAGRPQASADAATRSKGKSDWSLQARESLILDASEAAQRVWHKQGRGNTHNTYISLVSIKQMSMKQPPSLI